MALILESDILYNILSRVDLKTIGVIFRVNKHVNKLCSDNHFWKDMFIDSCSFVIVKSNDWLCEYKNIVSLQKHNNKLSKYLIKKEKKRGDDIKYKIVLNDVVKHENLQWVRWIVYIINLIFSYKIREYKGY